MPVKKQSRYPHQVNQNASDAVQARGNSRHEKIVKCGGSCARKSPKKTKNKGRNKKAKHCESGISGSDEQALKRAGYLDQPLRMLYIALISPHILPAALRPHVVEVLCRFTVFEAFAKPYCMLFRSVMKR